MKGAQSGFGGNFYEGSDSQMYSDMYASDVASDF